MAAAAEELIIGAGVAFAAVRLDNDDGQQHQPRRPWVTRLRSRSVSAQHVDPRQRYRAASDPNDPVHENFPLLGVDPGQPLVPVVAAAVGHPTEREILTTAKAKCGTCVLFTAAMCLAYFIAFTVLHPSSSEPHCDQGGHRNATAVDARCEGGDPLFMLLPECNTCPEAWDSMCDEPALSLDGSQTEGDCAPGTDGFDCAVRDREELALNEAALAQAMRISMPVAFMLILFLSLAAVVVMPVLCGCCCAAGKASHVPVIADLIFEVIRSRSLAVVEATALFLLAVATVFDARLCHSSFAITPSLIEFEPDPLTRQWEQLWPNGTLPRTMISFRQDDATEEKIIAWLFIARFVMCNIANNQWQRMGKNITGTAFVFAVFLSLWSVSMVASDAAHCKYPTRSTYEWYGISDNEKEVHGGYCVIYADGTFTGSGFTLSGLPAEGVTSKTFRSDCALQAATGWNDTQVSFKQVYEYEYAPPPAPTPVVPPENAFANRGVTLLPSRQSAFETYARQRSIQVAREHGVPPHIFQLESADTSDDASTYDSACSFAAGSVLEAIDVYSEQCETSSRLRESTLLVVTFTLLNICEVFLLIKLGVSNGVFKVRHPWFKWTVITHAESMSVKIAFLYPVRLLAAVTVSCLLVIGALSTIDLMAVQVEFRVREFEQMYDTVIVPFFQHGIEDVLIHNPYFDSDASHLPPLQSLPAFSSLDSDCPCGVYTSMGRIGADLWPYIRELATSGIFRRRLQIIVEVPATATGTMNLATRRWLQATGPCTLPNSHFDARSSTGCRCDVGFTPNTDSTACVPSSCPLNAHLDADGSCYCNDRYAVNDAGTGCEAGGPQYALRQIVNILEKEDTGVTVKCFFESLRLWYEPIPFAMLYAGILSFVIGLVSTILFLAQFRRKALRLSELVERYYDTETGWPKDADTLAEEDVRLLTGGKRTWFLNFSYLNKLPSFVSEHSLLVLLHVCSITLAVCMSSDWSILWKFSMLILHTLDRMDDHPIHHFLRRDPVNYMGCSGCDDASHC
jgi:hypothetical protein